MEVVEYLAAAFELLMGFDKGSGKSFGYCQGCLDLCGAGRALSLLFYTIH